MPRTAYPATKNPVTKKPATKNTATKNTHTKPIIVTAIPPFKKGDIVCDPDPALIEYADTTIEFRLDSKTPKGVKFTGFTSDHKEEFGKPVFSNQNRHMDIVDFNSKKNCVKYTLEFDDGAGNPFKYDPQIINDPKPPVEG